MRKLASTLLAGAVVSLVVVAFAPAAARESYKVSATLTPRAEVPAPKWPRISPAAFLTVCTLTYVRPASSFAITAFEIFTLPVWRLWHGPHNGTSTGPATPGLAQWICAAVAPPVRLEKVSFHLRTARSSSRRRCP